MGCLYFLTVIHIVIFRRIFGLFLWYKRPYCLHTKFMTFLLHKKRKSGIGIKLNFQTNRIFFSRFFPFMIRSLNAPRTYIMYIFKFLSTVPYRINFLYVFLISSNCSKQCFTRNLLSLLLKNRNWYQIKLPNKSHVIFSRFFGKMI